MKEPSDLSDSLSQDTRRLGAFEDEQHHIGTWARRVQIGASLLCIAHLLFVIVSCFETAPAADEPVPESHWGMFLIIGVGFISGIPSALMGLAAYHCAGKTYRREWTHMIFLATLLTDMIALLHLSCQPYWG